MNSLLLWIGGLLVAVLGLLFAAPYVIDWNAYRGVFEEEASRILGRDVRVGGQVNLRLLPSPYVRFEKVRISDAGALLGEPFFRTEAFTLWLSPTPLLKGSFEASEIELDRPVLRLAVDNEGRGNWQALRITPGTLPFMPSDVVLQQVRIRDGIVSLRMPGTSEPMTLSGIEGELAASSLDGPYRFRGLVDFLGARRELRIGTSQREADGKLRYKASARSADSGNSYTLDGVLSELSPRGRHTGTLTAKLPLSAVFGGLLPREARAKAPRGSDTIDLKANLDGDLDGARLSDLTFAFEHEGKPQLVNGELVAQWRQGLRVETRLASRWLDLDQIVAPEGRRPAPVDTIRRLIGQASAVLPRDGTSLVTFDIDQVNLGGDALSGVRLALARAGGLTSIGELSASLPGNARGEIRGTLGTPRAGTTLTASVAPADSFEGEMVLHGSGYQRFAAWAGADAMLAPAADKDSKGRADAPFSIASRLRLDPDGVTLSDAQLEVGDSNAVIGLDWRWGSEARLAVKAEGRRIDFGAIAPGTLDLVSPTPEDAAGSATSPRFAETGATVLVRAAQRVAAIERAVGSLSLQVAAAELTDGTTTLKDVEADVAVKSSTLTLTAARATVQSGARLELQGDISGLRGKPAGTIRGWASAHTAEALRALLDALPPGAREAAGPLLDNARRTDFGFTLGLGGATPDLVSLTADGTIDASRAILEARLEGGLAQWREAPLKIGLDIDGAAAAGMVRRIAAARGRSPVAAPSPAGGSEGHTLQIRATGANAATLVAAAHLRATKPGGVSADYSGKAAIAADGDIELKGTVKLAVAEAAELALLAGSSRRPLASGAAVRGAIEVERKGGTTTLATSSLEVGASRLAGGVAITTRAGRTRLDGRLTTETLAVAGLLGAILDGEAKATGETVSADAASPWPDAPFALALVDGTEGLLTIVAKTASLSPELAMSEAEARIAFGPQRIDIQSLTGAALGGRFTARGTIEGGQAGAAVAIDARLTGAQLARLAPGPQGPAAASGEANLVVSITSRGLSPRAAMAAAAGKGEIEIRNGRVPGIGAEVVEKAAVAAIEGADAVDRAQLERIIAAERRRALVPIGNRKLGIVVADGAARIGALEIALPEATLRNETTVELGTLRADSEWQIVSRRALPGASRSAQARREPLPPLSLVWTGPLGSIARAEPRLSVEQLERELSIRKMERDAERLEELRRQDEERARQEQERQRRLENPERGSETAQPAAPVIKAPLPIPPQIAPQQPTSDRAPQPRVIRPPPRQREGNRSLQDMMMGQQP